MPELYIGLISGTSADAVDAALVDFSTSRPALLTTLSLPLPSDLRDEVIALSRPGANEIPRLAAADIALGRLFARAALELLRDSGYPANAVRAIGTHGQTLRHFPQPDVGTSLQIGDPNIVAELSGITTVADFRRRDMAAGGQGAPLAPAFHAAVLADDRRARGVLNLGGIANITVLRPDTQVIGFDTGPANALLDAWALRHLGKPYDREGRWAASASFDQPLLDSLMTDEYFSRCPPKSSGREYFHLDWLDAFLRERGPLSPAAVQATLCELTARSVCEATRRWAGEIEEVLVCGGGVHNLHLLARLQHRLSPISVASTATRGLDPDWVEAMTFAWLAKQTLAGKPGNLPSVTGASHGVVLGAIYPGPGGH